MNLKNDKNLMESHMENIDVKPYSEPQTQNQETKVSVWIFDKKFPVILRFHKATKLNGSSSVKFPLRFSAILNKEYDVKNCFFSSILAQLCPTPDT